jgi:hypothetical protein
LEYIRYAQHDSAAVYKLFAIIAWVWKLGMVRQLAPDLHKLGTGSWDGWRLRTHASRWKVGSRPLWWLDGICLQNNNRLLSCVIHVFLQWWI